jgi:membrane protein DedA with SNARE-associated domain
VEFFFELLRDHFKHHGYWTVAVALLLENAGLPVPGESILLFATFIAYTEGTIRLPLLIPLAILAASLGDNIGYWIGSRGGRPLLIRYQRFFRISQHTLERGEQTFARYGAPTVFIARFVFGLRVIAGPLAGVLQMPWKRFVLFNVLGATVWVCAISTVGALFGRHWDRVLRVMGEVNTGALIAIVAVIAAVWLRYRIKSR